jgi:competence protein ComEA
MSACGAWRVASSGVPAPSKPQLAIYVAAAVAVLLIGARFLRAGAGDAAGGGTPAYSATGAGATGSGGRSAPDGGSSGADGGSAGSGVVGADGNEPPGGGAGGALIVDVKGAVRRPGVYRLAAGSRALDAVRRAGGLTHRADRVGVNLAARVVDGGEVVVPERGRRGAPTAAGAGGDGPDGDGPGAGTGGPLSIDLNTATEQQLEQLDGVGPATAAKIVAYRTQHGGIGSVDDLDDVPGIGPAKLAAIRAQLGR